MLASESHTEELKVYRTVLVPWVEPTESNLQAKAPFPSPHPHRAPLPQPSVQWPHPAQPQLQEQGEFSIPREAGEEAGLALPLTSSVNLGKSPGLRAQCPHR